MEACRIIYLVLCLVTLGCIVIKHIVSNNKKKHEVEPCSKNKDKEKEDLQFNLESVNSWVNNCDQKAGILLTVVGVAVTVTMTSDFMKFLREYIFVPFMDFCSGEQGLAFSWSRFSVFVLLVMAMSILITCCYYLFRAISANIDYDKMYEDNPDLIKTSYIFYGTISRMKYTDFRKGGVDYKEDLKSQIYVNSKIATSKFVNYNEGLFWFKVLLIVSVMLFISILFVY